MEDDEYKRARKRVEDLKGFYIHISVFTIVNLTLFLINLLSTPGTCWFYWITVFWGIGIIWHAFGVFIGDRFLGKEWEEKKIKEYMEREKRNR
ncbi:2TM domain-containing protein [Methanothermobacter thermautotrophicus]|uniref:2TM domain-containing protein n=1 Tax=Methanothermobacter thermautotrophicus TaxID=145262 RepID=UPI0022B9CE3C|nr:2TM domain-containing protein [Methanothermobacter thermautotrophicus]WBF07988.1 2TM domain-containing protein [Methanothermobacter thermautotrophicus]